MDCGGAIAYYCFSPPNDQTSLLTFKYVIVLVFVLDLTIIRVAQENLPHYFSCLANFACNQDAHLLDIPGMQSTRRKSCKQSTRRVFGLTYRSGKLVGNF